VSERQQWKTGKKRKRRGGYSGWNKEAWMLCANLNHKGIFWWESRKEDGKREDRRLHSTVTSVMHLHWAANRAPGSCAGEKFATVTAQDINLQVKFKTFIDLTWTNTINTVLCTVCLCLIITFAYNASDSVLS